MDELASRILDAAMELAERDGYEAVRIREVADNAGVALGTLYRRFASKEDILAAVLEREAMRLEERLRDRLLPGSTAGERLMVFFTLASAGLVLRPKLARAMLRTVASGEPELAQKVMAFHGLMTTIILGAMFGPEAGTREPTNEEIEVAQFLQQIWFGALVGWAGGLFPPEGIHDQMSTAIPLLLDGLAARVARTELAARVAREAQR